MPYNYNNTGLMNQLYRQKENIENMIAQYTQNMGINTQPPVQNIINTTGNNSDTDIRYVKPNEDISNIIVSKKTLFIDEPNSKISIKEVDGNISKVYNIIVPKDEKDIKIAEGRVLTEEKAREIIEGMEPYGKKWELADTEGVRNSYGYSEIRPVDFWIVMNSAYNDYHDLFEENVEWYAKFSKDFITDPDAIEEKVYCYFMKIPRK